MRVCILLFAYCRTIGNVCHKRTWLGAQESRGPKSGAVTVNFVDGASAELLFERIDKVCYGWELDHFGRREGDIHWHKQQGEVSSRSYLRQHHQVLLVDSYRLYPGFDRRVVFSFWNQIISLLAVVDFWILKTAMQADNPSPY